MKIIALIPARGGSKRVPDKNVKLLKGCPLIGYSIIAATCCMKIDLIYVSTNCPKIEEVAKGYKVRVLKRPDKLCTDKSTSEEALLHFANEVDFDILVFIQATSPLIESNDITQGILKIIDEGADSVLSVTEDNRFYWNTNRQPINYDPLNRPRTQDKEKWYKETGAFYITTREALLKSKCRVSGKIDFVIIPESRSFEIDTIDDFKLMETLMSYPD